MANKKLFAGITAAVAVLGVVAATGISNSDLIFTKAADAEYTLSVTASDIKGLDSVPYVTTTLGNQVKVGGSELTIDTTINLVGGSLYVVDPLNGIKSLTVDVAEESALPTLHYGWTSGEYAAETITLEDDVAADLTALTPNYFKLEGTANIVSIDVTYSCTPGENNLRTVYFNNYDWTEVYAYVWGVNHLVAWPGTKLSPVGGDAIETLYSFTYNVKDYPNIIFNNGSGIQTSDLKSPTDTTKDCYDIKTKTWIDDTEAVVHEKPTTPVYDIFLVPNNNWKADNARFAVYCFGAGETWVDMVKLADGKTYGADLPDGFKDIIFCRMNPTAAANNWDNKWNQTIDLKVPTDGTNCYTVKEGTWDKGGGTWSTYAG